jgi:putative nucleotidyltransferase with HDIG domain
MWQTDCANTLEARLFFLEGLLPILDRSLSTKADLAFAGALIEADYVGFIDDEGETWWHKDGKEMPSRERARGSFYGVSTATELSHDRLARAVSLGPQMRNYSTLVVPVDVLSDCRGVVVAIRKDTHQWSLQTCAQLRLLGQFRTLRQADPDGEHLDVLVELLVQTLGGKDGYTAQHSDRVAILAREIAVVMGLAQPEVELAYIGGRLHDIGKLWVDDHYLTKPGPLTPDEYESLKTHTTAGYELMNRFERLKQVRDVVLSHHERMDGRGYPHGLAGVEIPLTARIVSVADAYDAMTTDRSYRRGRPSEKALEELNRCSGAQFDRQVVDAFNTVFRSLEVGPVIS